MSVAVRSLSGGLFVLAAVACSRPAAVADPKVLPPLRLAPFVAELRAVVEAGPRAPNAQRLAAVTDLALTAFTITDPRLAARSRKALLADPKATWAIEPLLEHADAAVRSQAAFALAELGERASLVPLVLRLKYETDGSARLWVATALARLGNGAGLDVLIAAMDDPATAQAAGSQAIEILRAAGREVGATPTWEVLRRELQGLIQEWHSGGRLPATDGEPEVAPAGGLPARLAARLLALTEYQLRPVDDTRFIFARLGQVGLPLLRRAITAEEPFLRTHALEIVRELGPMAAPLASDLLPLLGDPLSRVDAARALAALRARAAAPFLRPWLQEADVELRAVAAGALGPLDDRGAEPLLRALMNDADEAMDVRVQAAFSVALFERDRPAERFLRERLAAGDYHEFTVREILDRLATWR